MVDKLTSEERMKRFYQGESIDRVPFISSATMYSGKVMGLSSEEFYFNVEKSYEAQKWVGEMHCCDGGPCYDLPRGEILDFGGEFTFSENKTVELPMVKKFPIENINGAIDYVMPSSEKWQFLNKKIEFIKYMRQKGDFTASISAGSPFTVVGSIIDTKLFVRWIRKEPEIIHKLLGQAVEYLLKSADIIINEFGIENCSVSSNYPFESNSLISSKTFEEFSLPYILDVHKKLREKGLTSFGIHLCGNQNKNLNYYRELNLPDRSFISVDEQNDLKTVSNILGSHHTYAGNVPSGKLVTGTHMEIYKYCEKIIGDMKYNEGGFILMPSCDLPINTSSLNLYAMLKATRDFGKY